MYKKRHIEEKLLLLARNFKVVLILGARQVGKSTLLKNVFPHYKHITFDPVQDLYAARQDPDLFLNNFDSPIILDEIQFVPELLPALKRKVDQIEKNGQYLLTGSQNFSVLKNFSESLAGRVAILHLGGLTIYETYQLTESHWIKSYLSDAKELITQPLEIYNETESLYSVLWRGSLPGLLGKDNDLVPTYLSSYVQTYIERDIRLIENIRDLSLFDRFLGVSAALTAQEVNNAHLGRELGINHVTASKWLSLMQYCYIWTEILPFSGNSIKRISQKRKGHITDTGLACYLQRISSPEGLARHPLLGSLFETFCVNMIIEFLHNFIKVQNCGFQLSN